MFPTYLILITFFIPSLTVSSLNYFVQNYLPDLRITEIVLSGEPAEDFDALINNMD